MTINIEHQIEIDWEAKFQKAVSDNVRESATHKAKQADTLRELQEAKREIDRLKDEVRRMEPAEAKRNAAEKAQVDAVNHYERRLEEMRVNRNLWRDAARRGRRGAIEAVVKSLQKTAADMPEPLPSDAIDLPEDPS